MCFYLFSKSVPVKNDGIQLFFTTLFLFCIWSPILSYIILYVYMSLRTYRFLCPYISMYLCTYIYKPLFHILAKYIPMSLCTPVFIYTYVRRSLYPCILMYLCAYIFTFLCFYMPLCNYLSMYLFIYIPIHLYHLLVPMFLFL